MTPRDSLLSILSVVIANAEPPAAQKELIMIAHENGLLTMAQVVGLFDWYDLRAE